MSHEGEAGFSFSNLPSSVQANASPAPDSSLCSELQWWVSRGRIDSGDECQMGEGGIQVVGLSTLSTFRFVGNYVCPTPPLCPALPPRASRGISVDPTPGRIVGRFETCPYSTIGSRAGLTARWEVYPDGGGGPGSRRGRCRSRPEDAVTDSRRGPRGLRRRRRTHGSAGRRCWTRPRAGP